MLNKILTVLWRKIKFINDISPSSRDYDISKAYYLRFIL